MPKPNKPKGGATPNPNIGPVTVALPNTTSEKMEAITRLSKAILVLSEALSSINTKIEVSNCTVVNAKNAGISIGVLP